VGSLQDLIARIIAGESLTRIFRPKVTYVIAMAYRFFSGQIAIWRNKNKYIIFFLNS